MLLLVPFAFLAGVVTVLSPCILPLLPLILSSADGQGKQKPLGVVVGFVASFTFFTLFLSTFVRWLGIPAESFRAVAVVLLMVMALSLLLPAVQARLEMLFSRFANLLPATGQRQGFGGGLLIGLSLGLLWTPCVGPILAAVISLALTGSVTVTAAVITFAYALGTAVPMFLIMLAGSTALQRVPWLVRRSSQIQRAFGLLMILTAVAIALQWDRQFQLYIVENFPGYITGLTSLEQFPLLTPLLEQLRP